MPKGMRRLWEKYQLVAFISAFVLMACLAVAYVIGLVPLGSDYSNLAFLVMGVVLSVFLTRLSEALNRSSERKELARALYSELANRLARCCFDFEKPWSDWVDDKKASHNVDVLRIRRFMPFPPLVFPATASKLALLNNDVQQALITFYVALDAYRKDMSEIADRFQSNGTVPATFVALIAGRLFRTLPPGYEALRALGEMVDDPAEIDAAAIRYADTLFDHERSHLPLRHRIEYYLTSYRRANDCRYWHFCISCSQWPAADYEQSIDRPLARDLCLECKKLAKDRKCVLLGKSG